jgi:hypothetical protein
MKTGWVLIVALALCGAVISPMAFSRSLARRNPKVLYLTQSKGFKHEVLPQSERVMKQLGERYGFDVTVSQDAASEITADKLKSYDAVFFYTTGELPLTAEQKQALLDFIKSGKAFLGVHSATDTFYQWAEYGELIGGYFDGHPWNEEVEIKVEDRQHPATRHLPPSFRIADEIYQFKNFSRERVKVLMSLDTERTDMNKRGIKAQDFPLAWWREYGKGRVFYTALGHRPEVWDDSRFQTMIANAIKWSTENLKK